MCTLWYIQQNSKMPFKPAVHSMIENGLEVYIYIYTYWWYINKRKLVCHIIHFHYWSLCLSKTAGHTYKEK